MAISANHNKFVYSDYISPLPADFLLAAAEKKQQMYDEGRRQVSQTIDAYGQLRNQMSNDAEKEYFDSVMNNYIKAVNDSAGLDFSIKGNVEAVLNIGKPIQKDNFIITGIQNGKEMQNRQKQLEELKPEDRSPDNDLIFMKDAYEHRKANKLGQKLEYGKQYIPFYDISEKVMEIVKDLGPQAQQEFFRKQSEMGPAYIDKITKQGFDKSELAQRIRGMLKTDPKAIQQLQVNTEAAYYKMGPENAYIGYIEDQKNKAVAADKNLNEQKEALNEFLKRQRVANSPSLQADIEVLRQNISYFEQSKLLAETNAKKSFEEFNPQDYYGVFQDNFITNLANTYSVQKVSKDLITNNYWKEQQERSRMYEQFSLSMQKEKKMKYELTDKELEVGTTSISAVLNNFESFKQALDVAVLDAEQNYGTKSGAYRNLKDARIKLDNLKNLRGLEQLKAIKNIFEKDLTKSGINYQYKNLIMSRLPLNINTTYDDFVDEINNSITEIENNLNAKSKDSVKRDIYNRQEISFDGTTFDNTLGSIENIDFLRYPLGEKFAIAAPDVSYSISYDKDTGAPLVKSSTGFKQKGTIDIFK